MKREKIKKGNYAKTNLLIIYFWKEFHYLKNEVRKILKELLNEFKIEVNFLGTKIIIDLNKTEDYKDIITEVLKKLERNNLLDKEHFLKKIGIYQIVCFEEGFDYFNFDSEINYPNYNICLNKTEFGVDGSKGKNSGEEKYFHKYEISICRKNNKNLNFFEMLDNILNIEPIIINDRKYIYYNNERARLKEIK